jgi:hypothetical protein
MILSAFAIPVISIDSFMLHYCTHGRYEHLIRARLGFFVDEGHTKLPCALMQSNMSLTISGPFLVTRFPIALLRNRTRSGGVAAVASIDGRMEIS